VAAVVVVASLAVVFAQIAMQRGGIAGPGAASTVTQTTPSTPELTATPLPSAAVTNTPGGYSIYVYFPMHPDSDNDPNAVFVVRRVSPTSGVATYAIQRLIAGPEAAERDAGYFTELSGALNGASDCGADFAITLNRRATHPQTGAATLRFCRTLSLPAARSHFPVS
jgi:hypothetical protein